MTTLYYAGYINRIRERLRKENVNESHITALSTGEYAGCLQTAIERLSRTHPYERRNTIRICLPEDDDYIVDAEDISAFVAGSTCTVANSPDVVRNITLTVTDADSSITAFTITVVGTGSDDEALTEVFYLAGGLEQTGTELFKTVTSVTATAITGNGAGDTIDIGIGTTLGGSNEIDLTAVYDIASGAIDLTDEPYRLIRAIKAEHPIGGNPKNFRNVKMLTDTICEIQSDTYPDHDQSINLYWVGQHVVTADSSTIPAKLEDVLVAGAAAQAVLRMGQSMDNQVSLGKAVPDHMKTTAAILQQEFERGLKGNRKIRMITTHPRS